MNQKYVLKHNEDIEKLVAKKCSVGNKYYAIYFDKNNETKVAISISKKCGSSPVRNYEKRVLREIIRLHELGRINGYVCLFIIKKESINLNFEQKQTEINNLITKMLKK